jgi:heme/copper-type cytochrome/quinol oxidase subunit 2
MRLTIQEGRVALTSSTARRRFIFVTLGLVGSFASRILAAGQTRRDFTVVARRYGYRVNGSDVAEIRVVQNDLVHVTFSTEDIPHSFTIEEAPYRIMKRAEPGSPVSFSFRADQPGRFRFFCNLTIDEGCRQMQGTLIVAAAR